MRLDPQLLERIHLGNGKAEAEEHLERWFTPTATYKGLCKDRFDLVIGGRGSGKSALYHALTKQATNDSELANCIVSEGLDLSSTQGRNALAEFFSSGQGLPRAIQLWKLFLVGRGIASLVTAARPHPWRQGIDLLRDLGFQVEGQSSLGMLRRSWSLVSAQPVPTTVQGVPAEAARLIDVEARTEACARSFFDELRRRELRCWVALDRLDEVFGANLAGESAALRSLLIAMRDLNMHARLNSEPFRVKAFLRDDVFERALDAGPIENASAILRKPLQWDQESIAEVLIVRLREQLAGSELGVILDSTTTARRYEKLDTILPIASSLPEIDRLQFAKTTWNWILFFTRDASGTYNPRNIFRLISASIDRALEDLEDGVAILGHELDRDLPKLVACRHLQQGYVEASGLALDDLLSEYPPLRPLRSAKITINKSGRVGLDKFRNEIIQVGGESDALLRLAVRGGLVRREGTAVEIGPIYRPALKIRLNE